MRDKCLTLANIIWFLAISITLTIYLAWLLYPLEIKNLHLLEVVPLSKEQVLKNYNHLLSYLVNPFKRKLYMPDFPSSKNGLKHFKDVKHLFQLVQLIVILLLIPTGYFLKNKWKNRSFYNFRFWYMKAAFLPIIIVFLAGMIGFDQFFTLFHQALFPGDSTWLFDPSKDPVILILPEQFFLHCFLLFFIIYELSMFSMYLICRLHQKY